MKTKSRINTATKPHLPHLFNDEGDVFSIMKSGRSVPGHSRSDKTSKDKIKRSGTPDVPDLSAL